MEVNRTRRLRRSVAGVLLAALLPAACSVLEPEPEELGEQTSELRRQRQRWRSQGIDSYTYTVRRVCFCTPEVTRPVVVRVARGLVVERTYAESGRPVDAQHARFWPDVEGLFDVVQDAVDQKAHSVSVDYHPQLGYPTRIRIDYQANVADEELGFTASDLVPGR